MHVILFPFLFGPDCVDDIEHQLLSLDGPALGFAEASTFTVAPAYSIGLAVAVEKLPALGSTPLPNLEGGFWPP